MYERAQVSHVYAPGIELDSKGGETSRDINFEARMR